jgi:hypothetical protein
MAKRKEKSNCSETQHTLSFTARRSRRRSGLFLRRFLAEEAGKRIYDDEKRKAAHDVFCRWADLEKAGHLNKKETSLDAAFLNEVFGAALHYVPVTENPAHYQLEPQYSIPETGTADGALGDFQSGFNIPPLVVIELKDASVDLDHDKFNGRTPVQQCWDYLNALPDCPWGIVSNFVSVRLYHRRKGTLAYEEFKLQELRDFKRFCDFYCIFERGGLVRPDPGRSLRAEELLKRTETRQFEVGVKLYNEYSQERRRLLDHLHYNLNYSLEKSIHIAQKLLDRIIFVAFCEDRDLLGEKTLDKTYGTIPPFIRVTNPRWRNFLDLFRAMDKGHRNMIYLETGYNGGLFKHDPDVDELQLDDQWTNFFQHVGTYDFRDEINVEVLGNLFERSVAELEKIRVTGLFGIVKNGNGVEAKMPKSAERKRFGIYYTPPEFTALIVDLAVGEIIRQRLDKILTDPIGAAKCREAFDALRDVKICDPACGSGAFLIRVYDVLETAYEKVLDDLRDHDPQAADDLSEKVPDIILADNIHGADVSPQAVEITQLALWVRSARRGKTLADLSKNIVYGNSLVADPAVHPQAMRWNEIFPEIFNRKGREGFDCVIGNPPWERMKVQEREFFALSAPEIANAVSAAKRRKLVERLKDVSPELYEQYLRAQWNAEKTLDYVRQCGDYPLTGKGDVNTYMVFAELAGKIVSPVGRVGLLVPSGIATDHTTREFFNNLIDCETLVALYDFENKMPYFPDVHRSFKFSVLVFGGKETKQSAADFAFFMHHVDELDEKKRHIKLSAKDLALMNPNTRTCPVFRSRRDAELTKAIYRRVPILIDKNRKQGGNPWNIKFVRMFDQTNDAELFLDREELVKRGAKQDGNRWKKGKQVFLPLYEAKMVQAYDHRAASVIVEKENWFRQGQTDETTLVSHQNPEFLVQPRWWGDKDVIYKQIGAYIPPALLAFKNVTSPTNRRTMIASVIPTVGVINSAPLILFNNNISAHLQCCLLANLNSFILDYVTRQKIGNVNLNFFLIEQFPMFPPDRYGERCPWDKRQTLEKWISDRVLKLTCTAEDMRPLAEAAGFDPPIHKWNPRERAEIMAELDAAFFHLYGIDRDDVQYILSTFSGFSDESDQTEMPFIGENDVLGAYDRLVI